MAAGSPVAPSQFDWIYKNIKKDIGFASISGGSEVLACFMLGSPIHPVRRGELTVKGLGMSVEIFNSKNKSVIGVPGDLVCTEPFPSMPITFWGKKIIKNLKMHILINLRIFGIMEIMLK